MTGTRLERIAVALDTDDRDTYSDWCGLFGPRVGVLKVGPRVVLRWGRDAVREAAATGADVFLDMKFHDIPSAVAGAVGAAKELGVTYLTVHAGGGRRMLEAAAEEAGDEVRVLGITVLTHLGADDLRDLDLPGEAGGPRPVLGRVGEGRGLRRRRLLASRAGDPSCPARPGAAAGEPGYPLRGGSWRRRRRRPAPGRVAVGRAAGGGGSAGDRPTADAGARPGSRAGGSGGSLRVALARNVQGAPPAEAPAARFPVPRPVDE